ncbi:MAG: hypothetical protein HY242_09610 [Afipia sp.]|nr:hypothetical protein [Afipia sp.]
MTTTASKPTTSDDRRDAFTRLTPFGWNGGIAFILIALTLSFFLAGYFVIYWRNADMDFMIVYTVLAMNDGKPQLFVDHPAYFTILSVKAWFQAMHSLGLLDAWKLSSIPPAVNVPAFDAAMTSAIRAGRIVAWLTGIAFVAVYAGLIRHVVRDWRVALLTTFAFAFSGGIAVEIRILRSEMIAGSFFAFAMLLLVIAAKRATASRPLLVGAAAALCVLGMENKVQIILLIAALPVLMLPMGSADSASAPVWRNSASAWLWSVGMFIAAAVALALALPLIRDGFDPAATAAATLKPVLLGKFGIYQAALLAWIAAGMIAFAAWWRVSAAETIASMFAMIAGASIGLLALNIDYNIGNVVAVINPVEKMLVFADTPATSAVDHGALLASLKLLFDGVVSVLKRYSFVLYTSPRPTVFLVWLIIPGIVYAWRRGERQLALQATLLLLVAIGIDALGVRRGLKTEYFIFTDPLMILAGALLLDKFNNLRFAKWAYPIGVALIVAHVALSQAEAVKHVLKKSGPEYICDWNQYYEPELPLPWCDLPPKKP